MKQIFIMNSCNEWKEYSSMSLIMATTSIRKIKSEIVKRIKEGDFEYMRGEENLSTTKQIKKFKEDFEKEGMQFTFDNIEYGYIAVVEDGEIR